MRMPVPPSPSPPLANTPSRYGVVAMLIHWGMALLLAALLAMGWYMVSLPDAGFDGRKIGLILAHKSIGMFALLLVLVRIAWRNMNALPRLPDSVPGWQQGAAYFVHLCFYALMLALPVTGWLMSSAGGFPVYLWFDRGALPDLIRNNESQFRFYIDLHRWLAWALLGFLLAHAAAALVHHFVGRDDTMRKMLP
jgi:cytochrome b561